MEDGVREDSEQYYNIFERRGKRIEMGGQESRKRSGFKARHTLGLGLEAIQMIHMKTAQFYPPATDLALSLLIIATRECKTDEYLKRSEPAGDRRDEEVSIYYQSLPTSTLGHHFNILVLEKRT